MKPIKVTGCEFAYIDGRILRVKKPWTRYELNGLCCAKQRGGTWNVWNERTGLMIFGLPSMRAAFAYGKDRL